MKEKSEAVFTASGNFVPGAIVANNFDFATNSDQNNYHVMDRAGFVGAPLDPYLTYTDNSPSDRGQNPPNFQHYSLLLYFKTMDLYKNNKKFLQLQHIRGWQKLKFINSNTVILYSPSNPSGNSNAGWKLAQNMSNTDKARLSSKQHAYEKALANVDLWEYFATFTLDRTKQDRYDFKKALTHITKFLQYRHVKYFMVPERHKDGAWHFHALLSAEIGPHLANFEGKALKNRYIKSCIAEGKPIKHCKAYTESFGYNTIEPCRNKERCTHYMTKYVLKTFDDPNFERVSRRRYFCSTGLKSPVIVMPNDINLDEFEVEALSKYTEKVYLRRAGSNSSTNTPISPSNFSYSLNSSPG